MLTRITRRLVGSFCANKPVQQTTGSSVMEASRSQEVPVHLRPYEKSKYEVPMEKIKMNSGIFRSTKGMLSSKLNLSQGPKS